MLAMMVTVKQGKEYFSEILKQIDAITRGC